MRKNLGFTLIELLIVIGVIAILASLAFVALNPLARFQDSRNTQRRTDVNTILSAIKLYQVDNEGVYPDAVNNLTADLYYQIGGGDSCSYTCSNPTVVLQTSCVDLEDLLDSGYIADAIPHDPSASGADEDHTYYYLVRMTSGSIQVGACSEELGSASAAPQIMVTR